MRPVDPPSPLPAAEPSKTRRKKDMLALQDLGSALVALDPRRLAELGLPERLTDAVIAARGITKHEARRRQMQFIGRLMRDVDPEPIRAALDRAGAMPRAERARFAAVERWRDRLFTEDDALAAFVTEYPDADRAALGTLIAAARAERARGAPPHQYRALFRALDRIVGAIAPR